MKDGIPTVNINARNFPYWYDKELITLMREKERIRINYVKHARDKSSVYHIKFCALRKELKN